MKKLVWIGGIVGLVLSVTTIFFPYSFFSVYKSVSVQTELPILQDYKTKLYEFRKVDEENEGWNLVKDYRQDNVKYFTESVLNTYQVDMMTTSRSKISKSELNEMLESIRSMQNSLLYITFEEEHSSESRKYLHATLRWCNAAEEDIVRIKSFPYYTRFQLNDLIEEIQNDIRMSFDMYTQFYNAYYWYEGE